MRQIGECNIGGFWLIIGGREARLMFQMSRADWQFRWITVVLLCAGVLGAAPATRPATQPSLMQRLVDRLASDQWKEREEASDALTRAGAEALPELQQLRRMTRDDDLRTRLDAVLQRIAYNQKFGPTLVSLQLKDIAPLEAMTGLAKQSGGDIRMPQGVAPRAVGNITADFNRLPFWEVTRSLCTSAQLTPVLDGRRQTVNLQYGRWRSERSCVAGPLLFVAGNVT